MSDAAQATIDLFDAIAAVKARDAALDDLEAARPDWLSRARAIAMQIFRDSGEPVSVDDVRAVLPPPEGKDPRVFGVVFRHGWRVATEVRSERKACHSRPIKTFVPIEE